MDAVTVRRGREDSNMRVSCLLPDGGAGKPFVQSLERQRLRLSVTIMALDIAGIFLSFLLAGALYLGEFPSKMALQEAMLIAPFFVIFGIHVGLFKAESLLSLGKSVRVAFYVMAISSIALIFVTFYAKTTAEFSRAVFTLGAFLSFLFLAVVRLAAKSFVLSFYGPSLQNTVIIFAGGPPIQIENAFQIDAQAHGLSPDTSDPANLDRLGRYMENMDRVIVSCPNDARHLWVPLLRAAGVQGEFVSDSLHKLGVSEIRNEHGFSSIVVATRPLEFEARFTKRAVDLIISSIALFLLALPMALIAAVIKLEDGGPVFFRQRRMGRGNRFFSIYKFRSMQVERADANGDRSASRSDDRTTKVGRFIRRTSIDELPQLFNVWRGDMSLVGPRPHALGSQAGTKLFWEVDGRYWNRHVLKPGITGLAQIRGFRGATECESDLTDRLQADLEYISNWSLWLDLIIIFRTCRVLVHNKAF